MTSHQSLPKLWLLSDARNDDVLDYALATLPKGNGFVFRHYHLAEAERRERFEGLKEIAKAGGHLVILSDEAERAVKWGADGIYRDPRKLGCADGLLRLVTAHSHREIFLANRTKADGVFLSPVFATRSHPDHIGLGPSIFREIAAGAEMPVIALGGMTAERAKALDWPRWAAIDGLS